MNEGEGKVRREGSEREMILEPREGEPECETIALSRIEDGTNSEEEKRTFRDDENRANSLLQARNSLAAIFSFFFYFSTN